MSLWPKRRAPDLWHEDFIAVLVSVLAPRVAIEVGIAEGRVTRILSRHAGQVLAIDVDPHAVARVNSLANVEAIVGDSQATLGELVHRCVRADFVFIDGDHRADAVLADLVIALEMLQPEGIVLLHDTFPRSVHYVSEKNEWCGNSYLVPDRIRQRYPELNVITIPSHPGCTLVQRNVSKPGWMQA